MTFQGNLMKKSKIALNDAEHLGWYRKFSIISPVLVGSLAYVVLY